MTGWMIPSPTKTGKALVGWVLFVLVAGFLLYATGMYVWNAHSVKRWRGVAEDATASARVQAKAAEDNAGAAQNTGETVGEINTKLPAQREVTKTRVEKIRENAQRPVDVGDLDPVGNDSMRELEDAYEAARRAGSSGDQLRRKRKR